MFVSTVDTAKSLYGFNNCVSGKHGMWVPSQGETE